MINNDYFTNDGIPDYPDREANKAAAYERYNTSDPFSGVRIFESISFNWWARCEKGKRRDLDEYRRHIIRATLLAGEEVCDSVVLKYPPPKGKLKIFFGTSSYQPRGFSTSEIDSYLYAKYGHIVPPQILKLLK